MKAIIVVAIAIFPRIAFGCMGGQYYIYHQDAFAMLGIGLLGIVAAIFIRITRGVFLWYLPVGVFVVAAFLPSIEWWRRDGGDCGIGVYESSVWAAGIAFLYLLYELVAYWNVRRNAQRRDGA